MGENIREKWERENNKTMAYVDVTLPSRLSNTSAKSAFVLLSAAPVANTVPVSGHAHKYSQCTTPSTIPGLIKFAEELCDSAALSARTKMPVAAL